jgi:UDP-GlcNAc:undecaprenyl-phosphate GlcNAc-1-phosphate transferase
MYIRIFCPELRSSTPGRDVVVIASLAMFLLGFWDDLRPICPTFKLFGQISIAAAVCCCGLGNEIGDLPFADGSTHLGVFGPILAVIWLVTVTNLINLVDGVDGLAGGIALMLMVLSATLSHLIGSLELLACGMAGALVGFLCFNFPPARIYLGDGGAYFLGFQAGLYSIVNSRKGSDFSALMASAFVLALPLADAVMTLARRGLRGLPLFRADRKHLHHRLLAVGYSRRKLVISAHALTFVFLLMGLAAFWSKGEWVPILTLAAILLLLICGFACGLTQQWDTLHRLVLGSLRIRRRVKYALSLARWLELESRLRSGPDELWPDLVFAAEKLGFTGLKLTLQQEQRVWQRRVSSQRGLRVRFHHACIGSGSLEFFGPACPFEASTRGFTCGQNPKCARRPGECIAEPRLVEIASELLAEAWNKAASHWNNDRAAVRLPAVGLVLGAICLFFLAELRAAEPVVTNDVMAVMRAVPAPELPAMAAVLVDRCPRPERSSMAVKVVQTAARINPAATLAVIGAVIRVAPDSAAVVSSTAVREQPRDGPAIARAAVGVAPDHAAEVVLSICTLTPGAYYDVAIFAARMAPSAGRDILRAVGAARSDLQPYIESELARYGPRIEPLVGSCLERAEMARTRSAGVVGSPEASSGVRSEQRRVDLGPKPPRGGGHTPGGRNYARP